MKSSSSPPEGARAREYLTGRGLKPETIAKFRIGYAPEGFGGLRDRLSGAAPQDVLRASGLFSYKEQEGEAKNGGGRLYDRFRKRITFPIANEGGRVIAFTARALDSDEKGGAEVSELTRDAALFEGAGAVQPG